MPRKPEAKPIGRPSEFSQEVAEEICARLAEGEPLRQICRDEHMPAWRTVYDWKAASEEFSARIAHARDMGRDAIAEDTVQIMDQKPERIATEHGDKVDPGFVQWQKNRVEQRMKLLAKWDPKKWGEKVETTLAGSLNVRTAKELTDDELANIAAGGSEGAARAPKG